MRLGTGGVRSAASFSSGQRLHLDSPVFGGQLRGPLQSTGQKQDPPNLISFTSNGTKDDRMSIARNEFNSL